MSTERWDLKICGCDASTLLADLDLTPEVVAALQRISALSVETSDYGCMPTLQLSPTPTAPDDGALCGECWEPFTTGSAVRDKDGDWAHPACLEST